MHAEIRLNRYRTKPWLQTPTFIDTGVRKAIPQQHKFKLVVWSKVSQMEEP